MRNREGGSPVGARRRALLVAAAAAAGTLQVAFSARQGRAAAPASGRLVETVPPRPLPPEFAFTDAEGNPRTAADFAGKGLLINLWATWCPPCVAEMPALDRAQAALAERDVVVLALSSDRGGRAQVEAFFQRVGVKRLGVWLDPRGAAQRAFGVRGLPTSIVVDRAGRERARLEGDAAWDAPEMLARLRRLVEPGTAPRPDGAPGREAPPISAPAEEQARTSPGRVAPPAPGRG